MKRFQYWRILIGARDLVIWNRTMECEVMMPSYDAFKALLLYWNSHSKDWLFAERIIHE